MPAKKKKTRPPHCTLTPLSTQKTAPPPLRGRRRRGPRRRPRLGPAPLRRPAVPLGHPDRRQRRQGRGAGREGEEGGQPLGVVGRDGDVLQRRVGRGGASGAGARGDAGVAAGGDV